MQGEKEFFRKRFFGGFNREDVVRYIARIAQERNEAIEEKEKAESKVFALEEELQRLRGGVPTPAAGIAMEPPPVIQPPQVIQPPPVMQPPPPPVVQPPPVMQDYQTIPEYPVRDTGYAIVDEDMGYEKSVSINVPQAVEEVPETGYYNVFSG